MKKLQVILKKQRLDKWDKVLIKEIDYYTKKIKLDKCKYLKLWQCELDNNSYIFKYYKKNEYNYCFKNTNCELFYSSYPTISNKVCFNFIKRNLKLKINLKIQKLNNNIYKDDRKIDEKNFIFKNYSIINPLCNKEIPNKINFINILYQHEYLYENDGYKDIKKILFLLKYKKPTRKLKLNLNSCSTRFNSNLTLKNWSSKRIRFKNFNIKSWSDKNKFKINYKKFNILYNKIQKEIKKKLN